MYIAFDDNYIRKGGGVLEENKILKGTTKAVIFALDKLLKVEANTTSCLMLYQPKAPKALERYKKQNK